MRHEHLTVTVEGGTKARIEDDLDGGETVEAWIADAIEQKLASGEDDGANPSGEGGPNGVPREASDRDRIAEAGRTTGDDRDEEDAAGKNYWDAGGRDGGDDADTRFGESDDDESDDDPDRSYEFVDDCGI